MIKVYLSGKITGRTKSDYETQFSRAEQFYIGCGFEVVNPCKISDRLLKINPKADYEDFMKEDLNALRGCTHIALLEGWEDSKGAKREKAEAEKIGLEVMHLRFIGGKK